eukprot:9818525-Alexandrium_andersonii.AAC.1
MAGLKVSRTMSSYAPAYRRVDANLRGFVLMRACLGHACPWATLRRLGCVVSRAIVLGLALRQRSDKPL